MVSWTLRRMIAALGLSVVLASAFFGWRIATRPVSLTVAVGPAGYDDAALIAALTQALAGAGAPVRLSVRLTSGQYESQQLLRDGLVQLAVIRNEGDAPDNARAVALLHRDPVIVMAPRSAHVDDFYQLSGKTIGLAAAPSAARAPGGVYHRLIEQLRRHYQGAFATVEVAPDAQAIAAGLKAGKFDALLFVAPTTRDEAIAHNRSLVRKLTGKAFGLVAIGDAEAIAAAAPFYEDGEVDAGAFGGRPLSPEENVTTLLVSSVLVADEAIPAATIDSLTRFIFDNRARLAAQAPVAALIKAADTERDANLLVHGGARMFYDGEEPSFFEQYGDWIYIGPMALGGLTSAFVMLCRFLGFGRRREDHVLGDAGAAIARIRAARSLGELDALAVGIDEAVAEIAREAAGGAIDQSAVGASAIVLRHVEALLRQRRADLAGAQAPQGGGGAASRL